MCIGRNASYKVQSKVCEVESFEFLFLRFRDLRNFNFVDFAFYDFRFFDSVIAAPRPGRMVTAWRRNQNH